MKKIWRLTLKNQYLFNIIVSIFLHLIAKENNFNKYFFHFLNFANNLEFSFSKLICTLMKSMFKLNQNFLNIVLYFYTLK